MQVKRFGAMDGVYILTPQVLADQRGRLISAYDFDKLQELCGLEDSFVHSDIYHLTARGLVGLYYQEKYPRASLYSCLYGKAQIVAVNLREGSRTTGKFTQAVIDAQQCLSVFSQPGFATGCIAVNGPAVVYVEHTTRNIPEDQKVLRWDDPQVGVTWATGMGGVPVLGMRERMGVLLNDIKLYQE